VSPDGSRLYVAEIDQSNPVNFLASGSVEAIWAWTGAVIHPPVTVGVAPAWIAMSPDGSKVYALNFLGDSVSVIDVATWAVSATVPVGSGKTSGRPVGVGVSADGTRGFVTVFGPDSLSKAPDPTTLETGDLGSAMGKQPGTVMVIDPATGAAVGDPIPVGAAGPTSVVVE
jgi:YVTN family beta-propeller protein